MDENQFEENSSGTPEDTDDFIIGKGFSVDETPYEPPKPTNHRKKKKKAKSIIKTVIWIVAIIIVSVGIAFGVIFAGADFLGIGFGRGVNCVIEIDKGASTRDIAEVLKESGAVKSPILFRVYSKLKHFDGKFKYGVYSFNNEAGYDALAEMLMTDGAKAESVSVTIPEMSSIDDIAKLLEDGGVCKRDDFIEQVQNGQFDYDFVKEIPYESVYYRLEGYLFPDTYDFYSYESKECAYLAVDKMLKTLDEKITQGMRNKISTSGYSFNEIMTMASLVELESGGSTDEMANVAAVFFNRLKSADYSTLGSSPTRKYPHGNGRYNTYEIKGLPPGPLCSPSIGSIKAAIEPTPDFDYYYFVTDKSMKFYYNRTLDEHNNTIATLKKANNWIYEE